MKTNTLDLINFLGDYGDLMISTGGHSERVRRCIKRMALAYGFEASVFVLLKNITITITDLDDYTNRRTYVKDTYEHTLNLSIVSDLSSLSWFVSDEKLELKKARRIFTTIQATQNSKFSLNVLFMSAAFGSFCKLFGGDMASVCFVIFSTLVGVLLRQKMAHVKLDIRLIFVTCSFVSSFIAYGAYGLGFSLTPTAAVSSSILYLFPGIAVLNAIFDILDQNVLIGLSRAVNASLLIICMAIGIYMTLSIVNMGLL